MPEIGHWSQKRLLKFESQNELILKGTLIFFWLFNVFKAIKYVIAALKTIFMAYEAIPVQNLPVSFG